MQLENLIYRTNCFKPCHRFRKGLMLGMFYQICCGCEKKLATLDCSWDGCKKDDYFFFLSPYSRKPYASRPAVKCKLKRDSASMSERDSYLPVVPIVSGASTFWRLSRVLKSWGAIFLICSDVGAEFGVSPESGLTLLEWSRRKWTKITPVKPRPSKFNLRRCRPKWAITRGNEHWNSGKWGKRDVLPWQLFNNASVFT